MDINTLKILAAVLSLIGSGLLAWRVSGILSALAFVARAHEENIRQILQTTGDIYHFAGAPQHVERAEKRWLLWIGFGCLIVSALLQLGSLFI